MDILLSLFLMLEAEEKIAEQNLTFCSRSYKLAKD